jgi:2-haloalkanoic acid dehalogenase type II
MADPSAVRALTFDCYGTLIDWEAGIRAYLRDLLDRKGARDLDVGRFHHHWYYLRELPAIAGPFMLYDEVLQTSLRQALADFGLEVQPDDGADFGASMKTWQPFPDTHGVLSRLAAKYPLCIISNTTHEIIADSIRHMDVRFAQVVTAQDAAAYKPDRRPFELALSRLGLPPGQVLHVFQSLIADLFPARQMGFQTAWINRQGESLGSQRPHPDWTFPGLAPLAELLGV